MNDEPVTIIGGGLAGLAAALHLVRAGVTVTVLEAADEVGGQVRTGHLDGFLIDRGFQVHNTAYPEPARLLDTGALNLRHFLRGALLCRPGKRSLLADPRQRPTALPGDAFAPVGSLKDRVALAVLAARVAATPVSVLLREPERSTVDYLRRQGLSRRAIDGFLRPFLSGVFLETGLDTSSRFFLLTFRCFVRGSTCVPAAGMGAIPQALAALLPPGVLRLGEPAEQLPAGPVVVATDTRTAHTLLPELGEPPALTAVTTIYHVAKAPPLADPVLLLDATATSPIANSVVLTNAAPTYAPPGRHLVSTSVVAPDVPETRVREALRGFYGDEVADWEHLTTVSIPAATPLQPPPLGNLRKPVRVRQGVYVAGAHRDTASTQGALVSGRRAAAALLHDRSLTTKETHDR